MHGLHRWHNEYNVVDARAPGAMHVDDPWDLLDRTTAGGAEGAGAAVVGTPDDLVAAIRHLHEITGGFGVVLGFAHDWADREATLRSWDLVARYVVPEINGYTAGHAGVAAVPPRQPGRPDGRRRPGRDGQDHGPRGGGQGDGDDDGADASGRAPSDAAFRPGAGVPGASAADDGEGDGGGVTDVERVDVGGDGDAHLPVGGGTRARVTAPDPRRRARGRRRVGHVERPDRLGAPDRA